MTLTDDRWLMADDWWLVTVLWYFVASGDRFARSQILLDVMEQPAAALKKTPLNATHRALGARMMAFGGWDMPIEYSSIVDEHVAVRTHAGLFDVSHMGEIEIAGRDGLAALQHISSNDASKLSIGQAQYSAITTPAGCFVDDVLVYRLGEDHFLIVVNASNIEKDYRWIAEHSRSVGDVAVVNSSSRYALLAVQGPRALDVLQPFTGIDLTGLRYYWFTNGEIAGVRATVSRTGYTGEDGFEIFVPPNSAQRVWTTVLDAGKSAGLVPAGLGARDTLRLEAAMRLYGNDIDDTTSVLEADLGWIVGWNKPDFIGKTALEGQRRTGPPRKLVGFEVIDRGIARQGHDVYIEDEKVGVVTSGTHTPFLKKAIGMAYVPSDHSGTGRELGIDIRGKRTRALIVPLPFYKCERPAARSTGSQPASSRAGSSNQSRS